MINFFAFLYKELKGNKMRKDLFHIVRILIFSTNTITISMFSDLHCIEICSI